MGGKKYLPLSSGVACRASWIQLAGCRPAPHLRRKTCHVSHSVALHSAGSASLSTVVDVLFSWMGRALSTTVDISASCVRGARLEQTSAHVALTQRRSPGRRYNTPQATLSFRY